MEYRVYCANRTVDYNSPDNSVLLPDMHQVQAARWVIKSMHRDDREGAMLAVYRADVTEPTAYYVCTHAYHANISNSQGGSLQRFIKLKRIKAHQFRDDRIDSPTYAPPSKPNVGTVVADPAPVERAHRIKTRAGGAAGMAPQPPGSPTRALKPKVLSLYCSHGLEHAMAGVGAHTRNHCDHTADWYVVERKQYPDNDTTIGRGACDAHLATIMRTVGGERWFDVRPVIDPIPGCDRCHWRTPTRMHVSFLGIHYGSLCNACVGEIARAIGGPVADKLKAQ
jgi:hypothetical protein